MKKVKTFVALAMSSILVAGVLGGCGASTKTQANKAENKEEAKKTDESKEKTKEEKVDLKGRTIRFAAWYKITPEPGTPGADRLIKRVAELEEKYNFKLQWTELPGNNYVENIQTSNLAGNPPAEILIVNESHFVSLFNSDSLHPLSDTKKFDFSNAKWEKLVLDFTKRNGKIYGADAGVSDPRVGVIFNKAHLKKANLPEPYELYKKGEWTWDKFYEYAKKLTVDSDGDGVPEQYGVADPSDFAQNLVYSNGADIVSRDKNGTCTFMADKPEAMEALNFYQKLLNEKIMKTQPKDSKWDWSHTEFMDGKFSMMANHAYLLNTFSKGMKDDYGFVLLPKGPKAKNYVHPCPSIDMRVIPSRVTNPEEVAFILDKILEPYPDEDKDEWKENYYVRTRDKESVDITLSAMRDPKITKFTSLIEYGGASKVCNSMFESIRKLEKTPAAAIEAFKPQIEAELKKVK